MSYRGLRLLRFSIAAVLFAGSQPLFAERVYTFWRPEPLVAEAPTSVEFEKPFFEQRLIPVKIVTATEPVTIGKQEIAVGTPLYMVFNAARKIGYCTFKDRSLGRQAKTLFIPIADQRPCFVDSDNDGRFDKTFSVFDQYGGPPAVRGSIDGAKPLTASFAYQQGDASAFPTDLRVSLTLTGKRSAAKARIGLIFSRGAGDYRALSGTPDGDGSVFSVMNVNLRLKSVAGDVAQIDLGWDGAMYVSASDNGMIFWTHLAPALTGD